MRINGLMAGLVVVLATPSAALWPTADASATPTPIALIELEYHDTSGEPQDQSKAHEARLQLFMKTLREDLDASGNFKVVDMTCDPAPCSIDDSDADGLLASAKAAGAKLMLFGGIHKVSTLIQFAKVQVVDVERDKVMLRESMSFRGDDDRSWLRMEKFLTKQMNEKLVTTGTQSADNSAKPDQKR